jgi:hypothetical protein
MGEKWGKSWGKLNRQTNKYKSHRTKEQRMKKNWESLFLLEFLVVEGDSRCVDKEKED